MPSSKKILFIEDDFMLGKMYQLEFAKQGYALLVADGGEVGLKMAESEKPDLILLDLLLWDASGMDVLKKLKQNSKTKSIKVVVATNFNKKGLPEECVKMGAVDFFMKADFLPKEVVEKVKGYFAGKTGNKKY